MKKSLKVLSLFDGISCAKVAAERAGFNIESYHAAEIDKYAISVAKKNHPDIIHIGDVNDVKGKEYVGFELLIGGSPCTDLSISKRNREGLEGKHSSLFWQYVRIKQESHPRYFILENVASMPQKDKDIISEAMGVKPIMICASLVSGQMRKRLFWTNIPGVSLPEDKGILLKDIMELDPDKIYYVDRDKAVTIDANYAKGCSWEYYQKRGKRQSVRFGSLNKGGQGDRVYHPYGKSVCLSSNGGGRGAKTGLYICLKDVEKMFPNIRKLTPVECERLQGLPDGYTDNISNTQRYKTLGNAFNVDVVAHIISHIPL